MLELFPASPRTRPEGLPCELHRVRVPPIKCQGIKTKLVPFILSSIRWDGAGRWIEPFLGSGVVVLNLDPSRALLADTNVHIVRFYHDIASGRVTPEQAREYLQHEGRRLYESDGQYYYEVRERFNTRPNSLDFLFLTRSCFNGLMRFNRRGKFNVPFCKKPDRFRRAYITKIVNQVAWFYRVAKDRDWVFAEATWTDVLSSVRSDDFVYADPPYIGRHTDYYSNWTEEDATELFSALQSLPCGFALSTWKRNKYRANPFLEASHADVVVKTRNHFYHVGPTEDLRNEMIEALVISKSHASSARQETPTW